MLSAKTSLKLIGAVILETILCIVLIVVSVKNSTLLDGYRSMETASGVKYELSKGKEVERDGEKWMQYQVAISPTISKRELNDICDQIRKRDRGIFENYEFALYFGKVKDGNQYMTLYDGAEVQYATTEKSTLWREMWMDGIGN